MMRRSGELGTNRRVDREQSGARRQIDVRVEVATSTPGAESNSVSPAWSRTRTREHVAVASARR